MVDGTFILSPEGIENLKPLTSVTLQTSVAVFMGFNLHVFQPPQDVFASCDETGLIHIINALCWPPALFVSFRYLWAASVRAAFPSAWRMSLFRLCQLVSENVYFILKHLLMLKEAVQQDWSQEPRGHQALGTHILYVKWPGAVGLPCLVFLGCRVPVKTPLLWKLFCRLLLGLFRLSLFRWFSPSWTHVWVGLSPPVWSSHGSRLHPAGGALAALFALPLGSSSVWLSGSSNTSPALLNFFSCSIIPSNFECFYTSGIQ